MTIAAISTGQAPGGIGVVRISGSRALEVGDGVFRGRAGRKLAELAGYSAAYGMIVDRDEEKLDDCVALVFRGPKSYTGEDVVEFSCHGGLYITRLVLREILDRGAVLAGPGEFTRRAFLNGKMDLAQAESVMEVIGANGRQALRLAQAGGSGALSMKIESVCQHLEELAAHLAAWADFPEEDVEEVTGSQAQESLAGCQRALDELLAGFQRGELFRKGLRTVIAGRPNVGKSTLMNLLSGQERSIVTPYPGTTRDVVEDTVTLGGVPLLLADTAGLRQAEDPVERLGVEAAVNRVKAAQLVLAVFDWSRPLGEEDVRLAELLQDVPVLAIVNKCDLEKRIDLECIKEHFPHWVRLSASQGKGLEDLEAALSELLGVDGMDFGEAELFTERQRTSAQAAREAVCQALDALKSGMTLDAVTVCVEGALGALYELTGRQVSESIIDRVFQQFCVGK